MGKDNKEINNEDVQVDEDRGLVTDVAGKIIANPQATSKVAQAVSMNCKGKRDPISKVVGSVADAVVDHLSDKTHKTTTGGSGVQQVIQQGISGMVRDVDGQPVPENGIVPEPSKSTESNIPDSKPDYAKVDSNTQTTPSNPSTNQSGNVPGYAENITVNSKPSANSTQPSDSAPSYAPNATKVQSTQPTPQPCNTGTSQKSKPDYLSGISVQKK